MFGGNLRSDRAATAMHPAPVQAFQKSAELGYGHTSHIVVDSRPLEAAGLEVLGHPAQVDAVLTDQLDPVRTIGHDM